MEGKKQAAQKTGKIKCVYKLRKDGEMTSDGDGTGNKTRRTAKKHTGKKERPADEKAADSTGNRMAGTARKRTEKKERVTDDEAGSTTVVGNRTCRTARRHDRKRERDTDDNATGNTGTDTKRKSTRAPKSQRLTLVDNEYEEHEDDEQSGVKEHTMERNNSTDETLPTIRTRSSPHQLFKGIIGLSETQRAAIREIGFEKMLHFRVNGIPSALGHFVVDKFDQDKMEIDLGDKQIKIDGETIHQLFGVPNGGVQLSSTECTSKYVGVQLEWRSRYPGRYVSPAAILKKMEEEYDVGGMFKLDFLALFLSAMGGIQQTGKCKLEFVHHIRDDTNLRDIDWCSVIVKSMKNCKTDWRRCDKSSYFTGALTVLAISYVDRVVFPGFDAERVISPIKFWTFEKLQRRETFEVNNGGFGLGRLRDSYMDVAAEEADDDKDVSTAHESRGLNDLTEHVSKLDRLFERAAKNKKDIESALRDACLYFPSTRQVKLLLDRYNNLFKDAVDVEDNNTKRESADVEDGGAKLDAVIKNIIDSQKGVEFEIPSFSLGISSQESAGKQHEPHANRIEFHPVEIDEPMNDEEQLVCRYVTGIAEFKKKSEKRGATINTRQQASEEDDIVRTYRMDLFNYEGKLSTTGVFLVSMLPGKQVYFDVVDCWSAVLNYQERYRSPGTISRLFCRTTTIAEWMVGKRSTKKGRDEKFSKNMLIALDGDKERANLRLYDAVLIPIFERNHFYVMAFDLVNGRTHILDNMASGIYGVRYSPKYAEKNTPYKVREIFCNYLASVGHPMAEFMGEPLGPARPNKFQVPWVTTDNGTDCGIFAMRHMECYVGGEKVLDCDFSTDELRKLEQLKILRMKYVARIILSEANNVKQVVLKDAKKWESTQPKKGPVKKVSFKKN